MRWKMIRPRFLVALIILTGTLHSAQGTKAVSDLVEELLNSTRYNSRTRPSAERAGPLDIYININVNDISSISEVSMEYSMTLYLRQMWTDDRLKFSSPNRSITLNHNQFDRLWTPDVFIRNLKAGVFHAITVPNRLIRLWPNGTILYSQRLTLTLACDMELDRYPMDNQTCRIEFGSYAYTTEDLYFNWRNDVSAVEMSSMISLPEYTITHVSHLVCSKNFSSTGSFPCLSAQFHLHRRLKAYILTTYLPSFLVVLLSWLSFWIDLESAPARTSLSILTILTITTQSSGLMRSMPAGSFTRAIDVWMATCLVFVFGAFIEYSIVNTLARRQKARSRKPSKTARMTSSSTTAPDCNTFKCPSCFRETTATTNGRSEEPCGVEMSPLPPPDSQLRKRSSNALDPCFSSDSKTDPEPDSRAEQLWVWLLSKDRALVVETVSRVLFPFMFLIFNLIYWPMYLL